MAKYSHLQYYKIKNVSILTLIGLGFSKVVFSGGGQFVSPFVFYEKLI